MGRKSEVSVEQRREAVLALLRREETAAQRGPFGHQLASVASASEVAAYPQLAAVRATAVETALAQPSSNCALRTTETLVNIVPR